MDQDFEQIIKLLRDIQISNDSGSQTFERLLNNISLKLEQTNLKSGENLIKSYINELASSVDDKYSSTLHKFEDIEKALKAIYYANNDNVTNSELKSMFDTYNANISEFRLEIKKEKAIISGLEGKVSELVNNKSDKEDIVRTISLLRKDFENLNYTYKSIVEDINTNLKSIVANVVKLDPLKSNDIVREQVNILYQAGNEILNILHDMTEKNSQLNRIVETLATDSELKKVNSFVEIILEKTNGIQAQMETVANKEDAKSLLDTVKDKTEFLATKEDLSKIKDKTYDLISSTEELKQTLGKIAQDMDSVRENSEIEDNLKNLYQQLEQLALNVEATNVKSEIFDIGENLNKFKNEIGVVKNIITDLSEVLENKIISALENYSFDAEFSNLKNDIIEEIKKFPSKEDLDSLLVNQEKILEKLFNKTENISDKLSTLHGQSTDLIIQKTDSLSDRIEKTLQMLENIASVKDYNLLKANCENIAAEIKILADRIENITLENVEVDNSEVAKEVRELANELTNISSKEDIEKIHQTNSEVLEKIEKVLEEIHSAHISEGIVQEVSQNINKQLSTFNINSEFTKIYDKTNSIENWLVNSRIKENTEGTLEFINSKPNQAEILAIYKNTEQILKLLEVITSESNKGIDSDFLQDEINNIKNILTEYLAKDNSEIYEQYIAQIKQVLKNSANSLELKDALDKFEQTLSGIENTNKQLETNIIKKLDNIEVLNPLDKNTVKELTSLSRQIENLGATISISKDSSNVGEFIAEKLREISHDINSVSDGIETRISQNLTYQTELIENKTDLLLSFIKEISSNKNINKNQGIYEKLELLENKLPDFKQEFEFISTDIVENISAQIQRNMEELTPISETLERLANSNMYEVLSDRLSDIQSIVETGKDYSDDLLELKALYSVISQNIADSENNLKDFIVSDTDAILIKIDNLKDYIEQILENGAPDQQVSQEEIKNYQEDFEKFKQENKILITEITDSIKEKIQTGNEELKSLISVAANHEKIIDAINSLQTFIKENSENDTVQELSQTQDSINEELKNRFEEFSQQILNLSNKNEAMEEIINNLSDKFEEFLENAKAREDKDEKNEKGGNTGIGANSDISSNGNIYSSFDMMKALDILKMDLKDLKTSVENTVTGIEEKFDSFESFDFNKDDELLQNINLTTEEILKSLNNGCLEHIKDYLENNSIETKIDLISDKLDNIAASNLEKQDDIPTYDKEFEILNSKIDIIAQSDNSDILEDISDTLNDDIYNKIRAINDKLDILATSDDSGILEDIADAIEDVDNSMQKVDRLYESDLQITSMLENLTTKVEEADFDKIKELIISQRSYIAELSPNERIDAFKKCLDELSLEVGKLSPDAGQDNIKASLKEMKESIMAAVVTIFDQVSFIEESEDIKDFVEERTDEINQNIANITKQLQQISNVNSFDDYTYSMQDIETDLAKLRLALKDIKDEKTSLQEDEFAKIKDKLHQITYSVDSLTQDEIKELKSEISNLKEQTQFLIASSDKSFNALYRGDFEEILNGKLTNKVNQVAQMLEKANNSDSVVRQSLIYMGEWIDSASESLNKISSKSEKIEQITDALDNLNSAHSEQLNKIEQEFSRFEDLEEKLEEQNNRINRLETALDRVINAVENFDDSALTRKIDKIEKQLSKLGTNIEKLTSYVD